MVLPQILIIVIVIIIVILMIINNNEGNGRNLWEVMDMFLALTVVIAS